jgi:3-deoxy-D-manno-octulosonic-acid transferase
MARLLYQLLLICLLPALLVRLLWRARRQPEYLQNLPERFGYFRQRPRKPVLWLHSVSVGESRAAQPLVSALLARHPNHQLLITCMTPTGRSTAKELYGDFAQVTYLPYDFSGSQRRFLRHWRPQLGILMETEVWPTLLAEAKRAHVPMTLVNARLSARSAAGYQRFGALARPAFAALAGVAAQTPADAERLTALGAANVEVCGNLKFEVLPDPEKLALGATWKARLGDRPTPRPVWLAASTREGEEAIVIDAFCTLRTEWPQLLLLLVPRHPQRFNEVAALAEERHLPLTRRSLALPSDETQVWLGDSMGEMAAYYAAADLCVMGGSLLPYGSQNLIEACACGCPVLLGPSDFNFAQAARDALAAGAAQRVNSTPQGLAAAVAELLTQREQLLAMRTAGIAFATAHRGATGRTLAVLERHLS